jgi:hypothetical protein
MLEEVLLWEDVEEAEARREKIVGRGGDTTLR